MRNLVLAILFLAPLVGSAQDILGTWSVFQDTMEFREDGSITIYEQGVALDMGEDNKATYRFEKVDGNYELDLIISKPGDKMVIEGYLIFEGNDNAYWILDAATMKRPANIPDDYTDPNNSVMITRLK